MIEENGERKDFCGKRMKNGVWEKENTQKPKTKSGPGKMIECPKHVSCHTERMSSDRGAPDPDQTARQTESKNRAERYNRIKRGWSCRSRNTGWATI